VDTLLVVALILINGLFAMAEIALVTAKRSRLQRLADAGDVAAATAIRLGEDPTRFLSTIQIGITAIGILNGIVGEEAFAEPLAGWLQQFGLSAGASETLATLGVVAGITYLTIVAGELVPKRIGQAGAERIARLVARPIAMLATLSRPFVMLLSASTHAVLRLFGRHAQAADELTEEDIHDVLREGSARGVIEEQEHEIVRKVFLLDDRQITSLMTPRSEIVWLDIDVGLEENLLRVVDSDLSRLPVCQGSLDQILGVATAKQLLRQYHGGKLVDLRNELQPGVFVPESLTGLQLLARFREAGVHMVFVVNEYGEIIGMVTLHDVLEALTGEFVEDDPRDQWAVRRADGSWLFDGLIPLHELQQRLGLRALPDQGRMRYNTLAGLMLLQLDKVPAVGDSFVWEDWRLEVVDVDGKRLDKVLVTPLEALPDALPDPSG
jgi:putative hemolysin